MLSRRTILKNGLLGLATSVLPLGFLKTANGEQSDNIKILDILSDKSLNYDERISLCCVCIELEKINNSNRFVDDIILVVNHKDDIKIIDIFYVIPTKNTWVGRLAISAKGRTDVLLQGLKSLAKKYHCPKEPNITHILGPIHTTRIR